MQEQNHKPKNTNKLVFLLVSIILAGSFIILLLSTLNDQRVAAENVRQSAQTAVISVRQSPTILPTLSPTQKPTESSGQVNQEDILAMVNGDGITAQYLQVVQASDSALGYLLGRDVGQSEYLMDRIINEELVRQEAQRHAYQVTDQEVQGALKDLLSQHGKIIQDLELSLLDNGISLETFLAYYKHLYLVDQFSRQQAQALNLSIPEYIQKLQSEAQISYGPAANQAALADETEQASVIEILTIEPTSINHQLVTSEPDVKAPSDLAPAFDLVVANVIDEERTKLEELHGKPVLLSFSATWCPYCQNQTPVLVQAHEEYGQYIQFIGIDVNESQDVVREYIERMGIKYPILLDNNSQVAKAYQVTGFPTTFFLDSEGNIVETHVGQLTEAKISNYLRMLSIPP